ncbi:YebC/PmpR family DNA-binding transcriptional regulator [Paracrocinitomix mangrovi]|uniref:YebC/PmpR family DNA-binding transcriptional regulator n=1 Tax=Paracrocinitomix mangrovi TaxID=2862509 RepID=UPI001C8E67CC|nr:YebC/PmpR family DNA-binding transcriptional regulator [Paracrocinitomix mangrovi]UKN03050.1 YebC/PmpR family DNA-binding transcriptional regulator [Paracrocinitomix mangrovi]
MGRAFEFRKARKMKRWGQMSKTFTKLGREITKAAKEGGPDPEANSTLRVLIQNAKAANMPKDNVERAIKKATDKNQENWDERVYEGYGQHGIAVLVETLTDNPTRTVANVRAAFNKCDGSLGTSGSVEFLFERKCMFKIEAGDIDLEEFEFSMIDFGAEEIDKDEEENEIIIYGQFEDFGSIQGGLEELGYEIKEANLERIPLNTTQLTPEQEEDVNKLIERLEDDDDVQAVFHTMG